MVEVSWAKDCLPNLPKNSWKGLGISTDEEFKKRVLEAVRFLKSSKPDIPILLVDHAGYSEQFINKSRKESFSHVNKLQKEAYQQLMQEGYSELFYLTYDKIGMSPDGTVDGTHPNDLGMMRMADALAPVISRVNRCLPAGSSRFPRSGK